MLSLVGILLYIAFRYQFSFAVGAVVATIHDLLVTLAFLAFFQYDLTLNVIAAILTVTGYSTNDTIVIFDRVRENLRGDAARFAERRHQHARSTRRWAGRSSPRAPRCSARRAVPVRRRGAARLRVHDDRRHHHRHLLERLHRRGDRDVLARQRPDSSAAAHAPAAAAAARRSSRPRKSKPQRKARAS